MRLSTELIKININNSNKIIKKEFKQIDIKNHYYVLFNYFVHGKLSNYDKKYLLDFYNMIEENINNKSIFIKSLSTYKTDIVNNLEKMEKFIFRLNTSEQYKGSQVQRIELFQKQILDEIINQIYESLLNIFIKYYAELEDNPSLISMPLSSKIEFLDSRNLGVITKLVQPGIRNATSHNGVTYTQNTIKFTSKVQGKHFELEIPSYEFTQSLNTLVKKINGALLSNIIFLNTYDILELKNFVLPQGTALTDFQILQSKVIFSTPDQKCILFEAINNHFTNYQINIKHDGVNMNKEEKVLFFYYIMEKVESFNNDKLDFDIFISQESSKSIVSFIKYSREYITSYTSDELSESEISNHFRVNSIIFDVNPEERNLKSDIFLGYDDIVEENYEIINIEDISTPELKRFRATAFVDDSTSIKGTIDSIIDDLKKIESYGFSNQEVKHGKMEADILFINIYQNKSDYFNNTKSTLPKNNNFIACVQYDKKKIFPLKHNFQKNFLTFETVDKIQYRWNPNFNN